MLVGHLDRSRDFVGREHLERLTSDRVLDRIGGREPISAHTARTDRGEEGEEVVPAGGPTCRWRSDRPGAPLVSLRLSAISGSRAYWRPLNDVTTSNEASGHGRFSIRPSRRSAPGAASSASAIASGSTSRPWTIAPRRAAKAQNAPSPQPRSSSDVPSRIPAAPATASQTAATTRPEPRSPRCRPAADGRERCRTRPSVPLPRASGCRSNAMVRLDQLHQPTGRLQIEVGVVIEHRLRTLVPLDHVDEKRILVDEVVVREDAVVLLLDVLDELLEDADHLVEVLRSSVIVQAVRTIAMVVLLRRVVVSCAARSWGHDHRGRPESPRRPSTRPTELHHPLADLPAVGRALQLVVVAATRMIAASGFSSNTW